MSSKEEELQDWINQVYYGNCCSHPDEEDEKTICLSNSSEANKEKKEKSNSK